MAKTYSNLITEQEVSLAIERALVAPYGTTWSPTKVDIASVPAGFKDLGAVVEDTPNLVVGRTPYQLRLGIPQTLQYEVIMGVEGRFEIGLWSSSTRKVKYALSNVAPLNVTDPVTISIMGVCNAASSNMYLVTWSTSPTATIQAGDWIVTGSSTLTTVESRYIFMSENEAQVTSVSDGTSAIYLATPGLPNTPLAGDVFAILEGTKIPLGGSSIKKWAVIGVADFLNGAQVVHYFPKVSSSGEWTEQLRPDSVGRINLTFTLYGYSSTTYAAGAENLIVGERFFFPATQLV